MSDMSLADKVVVVAGAGGPLADALAGALASAGARVHVGQCDQQPGSLPAGVTYHRLDVTSPEEWRRVAEDVRRTDREVHGLVNLAELSFCGRLDDVDLATWNHAISVNIAGAIYGAQSFHETMPSGSSIVHVGSSVAYTGHPAAAVTATMWGLKGLTRALNLELGGRGIRVNAVHPGPLADQAGSLPAGFADVAVNLTTLGRLAGLDDVTSAVVFLLSDASSHIAGTDIPVDAGATSHSGAKLARSGMTR
jgi:3alpha(or 20beta)-hydroxysteroid dehydrogenase